MKYVKLFRIGLLAVLMAGVTFVSCFDDDDEDKSTPASNPDTSEPSEPVNNGTTDADKKCTIRIYGLDAGIESELLLEKEESIEAKRLMNQCVSNNAEGVRLGIPFADCCHRVNCLTGTSKLNIRYDGNVYPCEAFKNEFGCKMIVSEPDNVNVRRLVDIYANSKFLNEVRLMNEQFQVINTCETCVNQYYRNQRLPEYEKIDR